MKKIVMLIGIAAAAYGAMKLFRKGESDEFQFESLEPQPQA
ncbi:MAG TPA: hypothetical protein VFC53_08330 [Dehalococcoidia bacterium]|nr:hypothetical protein [Dehalococcoidia bacterium]